MDEVSIEKARATLGDLVHDAQNGTATCITRNGKAAAVITPLTRLTDVDRRIIAKAHEVAALKGTPSRRERYGETDSETARAAALGEAQFLLAELAAIIGRLDGGQEQGAGSRP